MDAPTASPPTLPTASLHSTADNLHPDLHRYDAPLNNPTPNDGSSPLELSEAEMGLNLLKKQAELVRLEIQQLELELAIHQARHGNREPLASWQKKHGTPWPQTTAPLSTAKSPNHTSLPELSSPQHESLAAEPHNAKADATQHSPVRAHQVQPHPFQTSAGQNWIGSSPAGQGSMPPVLYSLLSNFSPNTTPAHADFANPTFIIRHPLTPGQHSHPSIYPTETHPTSTNPTSTNPTSLHPTNFSRQQDNLHQGLFQSPPSLTLAPYSPSVPYNAIAYQIHSHHNTVHSSHDKAIAETARENMTESLGDFSPITENPSSLSQHLSSPSLSPSPTLLREQSPHSLSSQPKETTPKASDTWQSTPICETPLPQPLTSPKPKRSHSQQPSASTASAPTASAPTASASTASASTASASTACASASTQSPGEVDHPATDPSDTISLIRPQAVETKTAFPEDPKALCPQTQSSQTQSSQTQPSQNQPANSSPAGTPLREPTAKPQTTRPNRNQRSGKKPPQKPASLSTSLRPAEASNRAVLSRKKTPSWVTSIAIHTAAILGLMAVTLKIPEVNAPFALTAFIEPSDSLAVEASPMETTTTLEASSENETLAESMQTELLQPETSFSQTDLQSAIATTTTALKPIVSDQANAGATSLGDKLAAGLLSTNAGGTQTVAEVKSLSKASFFGVQASGNIFCYVVDNSGSMRGEPFEATKKELLRSISLLKPNQRFYVLFFNQQLSPMRLFGEEQGPQIPNAINPLAPAQPMDPAASLSVAGPSETATLVPAAAYANPDNLLRLQRWIETVSIGNGGPPNQALKMAIELQPDCIFLLTDGVTRSDVTGFLRKNNRREDLLDGTQIRCQINTIGFYSREGEMLLQRIASENGGQYLYVPNPRDSQKP